MVFAAAPVQIRALATGAEMRPFFIFCVLLSTAYSLAVFLYSFFYGNRGETT